MDNQTRGRLFQPFSRGVSARHYGGLGLGLYIAQRIAASLGGTITVASETGAGSSFRVELPLSMVKAGDDADSRDR
jgi:signal transduction histidine kinase